MSKKDENDDIETLNIHQRMARIMEKINYVKKESKKVNNQYTFVSHDAVTALVRAELVTNRIVTIPRVIQHSQDGNRTSVDMEIDFVNIDRPEDRIVIPCFGYGIDPQDKGPGKAVSYAVKYAYLKAFALETGDDPERDSINHDPGVVRVDKAIRDQVYAQSVECMQNGDAHGLMEIWNEFGTDEKAVLWAEFNSTERATMKRLLGEVQMKGAA